MRDKYGLDTSKFTYDPTRTDVEIAREQAAESKSQRRCIIMWGRTNLQEYFIKLKISILSSWQWYQSSSAMFLSVPAPHLQGHVDTGAGMVDTWEMYCRAMFSKRL